MSQTLIPNRPTASGAPLTSSSVALPGLWTRLRMAALSTAVAASVAMAPLAAQARPGDLSEASAISGSVAMIPLASVAVVASAGVAASAAVVTVPAVLLSVTAEWLLISAQASARGTVWMLERASDGTRLSLQATGSALATLAITAGALIVITPVASGWVVSEGSRVLAYIPRDEQRSMFYNESL